MAGCITLKAAAANLAPMIQTFFEQSRCSGDKVVNLSSGLTEDDFVAFILIAIANFLYEENYDNKYENISNGYDHVSFSKLLLDPV